MTSAQKMCASMAAYLFLLRAILVVYDSLLMVKKNLCIDCHNDNSYRIMYVHAVVVDIYVVLRSLLGFLYGTLCSVGDNVARVPRGLQHSKQAESGVSGCC